MRVAFLNDWAIESFGLDHYSRGIEALSSSTCVDLLKQKVTSKPVEPIEPVGLKKDIDTDTSDNEEKKGKKYWKNFHRDNKNTPKERKLNQNEYLSIQVQNEVSVFRSLLVSERMLDEDCISTRRFWLKYQWQLPHYFRLTKKLLNIQASTAFVERFFSICGIICSSKNTNMNDKTIIMRSVLKANMDTLKELKVEEEN